VSYQPTAAKADQLPVVTGIRPKIGLCCRSLTSGYPPAMDYKAATHLLILHS